MKQQPQSTKDIIASMGGIDAAIKAVDASTPHVSFDALCATEPRLRELRDRVPSIVARQNQSFWHNWSHIKRLMSQLVGWDSGNLATASSQDYDLAYRELFALAEKSAPEERS